ncbi:MAG: dihydroorotase [Lachnospiraceae bacterium]|nr:dihydroorotase [Lachnospiraceae bacterium]
MIIKNGTILSPGTGEELHSGLRIADGIITEIGSLSAKEGEKVVDAAGCIVAPGLVDVHVHFRDPGQTWKEDLHTGAMAAAAGGFTTVVCMANTKPTVDSVEVLTDLVNRAGAEPIHVRFCAAVSRGLRGQELTDFEALAQAGACGLTDDGIPLLDEKLTEKAMQRAKALRLPLSFHEEHPAFIQKSGTHRTAPAIAEDIMVARDCMLSLHTGAPINIQHISSANSVALVRTAKALGAPVHAEATPHHFTLTEEAVAKYGTYAKMNPPLRTEKDRQAIIEGLKDGTIDIIATDHAPHSTEEKHKEDFFACPSGIIGLETALALGITKLVRPGHLTMMQLMEKMSANPAKLYSFDHGSIAPGCAADLVIFDPEDTFIAENYQSKSENTPFTGMELYGKIKHTICGGKIVWGDSVYGKN